MTEAAGPPPSRAARLAATPRRRLGLAALAGLALTLAQPPAFLWPLVLLAVPGLVLLLARSPGREAFRLGWAAGFGFFLSGLFWIAEACFVDAARHGWMAPFAVAGMAAGLALFWGLAAAVARRLAGASPWLPAAFAAALGGAEFARSHVLTGFPWALPGYALAETPLAQVAALTGPHGLGLLLLAAAAAPAGPLISGRRGRAAAASAVLVALLAAGWIWGGARLAAPVATTDGRPVVRIVQPNAAQRDKWRPELIPVFFDRLRRLSSDPDAPRPDVVIWPETAVPYVLERDATARRLIAESAAGAPVLLGVRRVAGEGTGAWRNALAAVSPEGGILAVYDKHRLVPFGEYLPFHGVLSRFGLGLLVGESAGFGAGPGPRTLDLPALPPVAPQICYETIFPHYLPPLAERPDWIVQVTNDAWFGTSAGPRQHFQQARMRAIEQGLPVVRAANTGISAVIDAKGRVTARLGLNEAGALQAPLPPPLAPTPYARTGDAPFAAAALALLGLAALGARRRRSGAR